jgi:maltooligosyltrehalose trehalohydrolase
MNTPFQFGPRLDAEGVTFRLWAPAAEHVELLLDRPYPMRSLPDGWHQATTAAARPGTRYRYRIDGKFDVPDPASHFQPEDVFGPSEVVDHDRYRWRATNWRGRPWEETAALELHVGTFTPAGTFRAAIEKLDHIADAGLTAVELMPIADFAGHRNWGYDGVLFYAPDSAYGHPDDLKALVDEAHLRGIMIFLDVVYNHFGPEGNYLGRYAPTFFTSAQTPWGSAIDYRVPQVRAFVIDNALHWLQHYRFDGLRLDAVHAIAEPGEPSILRDLSRAVGALAGISGRKIHLVLENDDNRATWLDPGADPPKGKYRAQWNDDYHHAWHVLLTRECKGYYQDYADDPGGQLARILSSGFAFQGEPSAHRAGRRRGEESGKLSPTAFVNFLQNHDQIGNRPFGDRLAASVARPRLEAALAVTLLAPMPPLLFMGEEWGSERPFPFFCDFRGELADAVRKGRRAEFKFAYDQLRDDIPDPLDEETFRSAVLDWDALAKPDSVARLDFVRGLMRIRHAEIVPHLAGAIFGTAAIEPNGGPLIASWRLGNGTVLDLAANLNDADTRRPDNAASGRPIWGGQVPELLPPWSVFWSIGAD